MPLVPEGQLNLLDFQFLAPIDSSLRVDASFDSCICFEPFAFCRDLNSIHSTTAAAAAAVAAAADSGPSQTYSLHAAAKSNEPTPITDGVLPVDSPVLVWVTRTRIRVAVYCLNVEIWCLNVEIWCLNVEIWCQNVEDCVSECRNVVSEL